MKNFTTAYLVLAFAAAAPAVHADAIEGKWKRPNGHVVRFSACGAGFCATAISGPHAGGRAGKLSPTGNGNYAGSLTDLDTNKTYTGYGTVSGNSLKVSGCVLGFLCRSETWTRQ
jgi:uncharacterized protein (DUF2147 family)